MTVKCTHPGCFNPAPAKTGICRGHRYVRDLDLETGCTDDALPGTADDWRKAIRAGSMGDKG